MAAHQYSDQVTSFSTAAAYATAGNADGEHGRERSGRAELRGDLGVVSLVFTVIAFNGPMAVIAQYIPTMVSAGNGLSVPLIYLTIGLVVVIFSVGLNAMARRMVQPGGFYTYIAAGLGRPIGLAAGLIALLSYLLFAVGDWPLFAIAVEHLLHNSFHFSYVPPWWSIALAGWAMASLLSLFNVDLSAKVLGTLAIGEIAIAVLWNVAVYTNGGPEGRVFDTFSTVFSNGTALALVFGVLSLTGFESLQVFRAESRDPEKTVPRATYVSVLFLAILYSVSSYGYVISYGASKAVAAGAADPTGAMLASMVRYVGAPAADAANMLLVTSMFAAALAVHNIAARYMFTFGRDLVLPPILGRASVRHGSPIYAAATTAVIAGAALALFTMAGFSSVEIFTFFSGAAGYCMISLWVGTSVAVVIFFHRAEHRGEVNAWQGTIAPIISAIGLGYVLYLTTANFKVLVDGDQHLARLSLTLLAGVFVAGLLLALWLRRFRPGVYLRIGSQH